MTKNELKDWGKKAETLELNDEARKKASGSFIKLDCGMTHYEMKGEGLPVVLTHGYATPYFIYDKLFASLVENGYRVLRFDLLGRGLSERVHCDYTPDVFARQLDELTRALLPDEKFFLVGSSMGGSVTTAFCCLYPGRVKALALLAPAGMDTFKPPFYMKLCSIPGFGDLLFNTIAGKILTVRCADQLTHIAASDKDYYMRSFAEAAQYKGFLRCTLSSLRHTILNTTEDIKGYRSVYEQKLPLLALWGTKDQTMPYYQHERLLEVCPHAELHTLEGSGHDFVYDECERATEWILPFFSKHSDD